MGNRWVGGRGWAAAAAVMAAAAFGWTLRRGRTESVDGLSVRRAAPAAEPAAPGGQGGPAAPRGEDGPAAPRGQGAPTAPRPPTDDDGLGSPWQWAAALLVAALIAGAWWWLNEGRRPA